ATSRSAIEDREMLVLEMRRAFDGLRAADERVEFTHLRRTKSQESKRVECWICLCDLWIDPDALECVVTKSPRAKRETKFEHAGECISNLLQIRVVHPLIVEPTCQ